MCIILHAPSRKRQVALRFRGSRILGARYKTCFCHPYDDWNLEVTVTVLENLWVFAGCLKRYAGGPQIDFQPVHYSFRFVFS